MSLAENITRAYGGDWHGTYGNIPTPGHPPKDRGTTVTDGKNGDVIFGGFNGKDDDWKDLKDDCRRRGLLPERSSETSQAWHTAGAYEYANASGTIVFRTVRKEKAGEPKKFIAERLSVGGWQAGLGDVERIPYRLPELLAAGKAEIVYFVEGERKADKLASMGLVATAIPFGCKGWRREYAEHFAGRTVAILPDNDAPGLEFAAKVQAAINGAGGKAALVDLPGLPPKGDIVDWNGAPAELRALAEAAFKPSLSAFQRGISAADLMKKRFEPVNYVVPGLIAEGATLFGGKPKIGKSWMAYDFALAIASGQPVFGSIPVDQGDVIYLALEDSQRRLKSRLLKKGVSAPERLNLQTEWPGLDGGCIAELDAWADAVAKPTLVIVDVLKMVRGAARPNESLYDADYRALAGLGVWARSRGLAVLIVHHVRKMESEDPLESLSGTNGLTGAADTVMVLKRDSGTGHCLLYVRGRDVEESEKAVRFKPDNGTWEVLGAAEDVGRTDERQAILNVLREQDNPLTVREVSDILGKNYDSTRKCLARMWSSGEIEKKGRGTYTCPHSPEVPNTLKPDNRTHRTGGMSSGETGPTFHHGNGAPILAAGEEDDEPFSRPSIGSMGRPLF